MCRLRRCCTMATSLEDLRSPLFWRGVFAELVGTLFLVLAGCGSCINWKLQDGEPSVLQIALCFGLAVAIIVWCILHLSGGHINPAVTISLLVTRKISLIKSLFFIIAQCTGAVIGAGALKGLTPPAVRGALGSTSLNDGLTQSQGFGVELMITMNPARSFGPAAITGNWHEHWVYWCGPILGGILAGLLYENLFASDASLSKAKGYLLARRSDSEDPENTKKEGIKIEEGVQTL
ncbi:hypothetical protein LSH36_250g02028 [Paralvinella palmiformis]|uniref:Uncharacterized protein n=1 Tax=Paralvinella palmiformis TaxID=53620 RepID=A0AAD9JLR0_9ANNE|nr:hypothetical protein LSH36_250g02028 [Paralvinella palmiformis]